MGLDHLLCGSKLLIWRITKPDYEGIYQSSILMFVPVSELLKPDRRYCFTNVAEFLAAMAAISIAEAAFSRALL